LFRTACALSRHGKIAQQIVHTFQNGYTRRALPCDLFDRDDHKRSASFNDAAVASGQKLVRAISDKTEGGIVVSILDLTICMCP
jgi:hypothetical protein